MGIGGVDNETEPVVLFLCRGTGAGAMTAGMGGEGGDMDGSRFEGLITPLCSACLVVACLNDSKVFTNATASCFVIFVGTDSRTMLP